MECIRWGLRSTIGITSPGITIGEDKLELVSTEGPSWLAVISGDLVVYADEPVDGVDGFGTVAVPQA